MPWLEGSGVHFREIMTASSNNLRQPSKNTDSNAASLEDNSENTQHETCIPDR
jgi:hypothetical protein